MINRKSAKEFCIPFSRSGGGLWVSVALAAVLVSLGDYRAANALTFTAGDLVVSVEGDGSNTGSYTDNQAAPLTLDEFGLSGTNSSASLAGSLQLPQTASGSNFAISGEYGSSSEGTLQLSGNGQYLTIMGYGVNAASFNASPGTYSSTGNPALGQSGSLTGQSYTPVPRVVALISPNGSVNTSTAVYNVFDQNNPRSAYTVNGTSIYISGQGNSPDNTGGVFLVPGGTVTTSPTPITGNDTSGKTLTQDTREVQVYNNTLYVSVDSKEGSNNARDFIGTLGSPPATAAFNSQSGPTQLTGFGNSGGTGKVTITTNTVNGVNSIGQQVNLSPENYFFANPTTLYVADSGNPKNNSATSGLGDGGLQKWSLVSGSWTLDYTLSAGLNLVANTASAGTTGLFGLTGEDVTSDGVSEVELFATNSTIGDTDPTFLYGITDVLADISDPGESFTELAAAPADTNFKGVAFAPEVTPLPATLPLFAGGLGALGLLARRKGGRQVLRPDRQTELQRSRYA